MGGLVAPGAPSTRVHVASDARRVRRADQVRAGDRIYCPGCERWERVTISRAHAMGRRFIRTDKHDAYKHNAVRVEVEVRS